MKKKSYLTTFLVLAVVVGYGWYSKDQNRPASTSDFVPAQERMVKISESFSKAQKMTEDESVSEENKMFAITPNEMRSLHENLPEKEKVNEETNTNHHSPSKSLMSFAKSLGPLMEKSFKDENTAQIVVGELSDCANNESVAIAARAMCVTNIERLAKVYTRMEKAANELRAGVSPEVQKILDTNDRFIKR